MSGPTIAQGAGARGEVELVEVVRIRLSNRGRAIALLSEFHSADRVLASWAVIPGFGPVDFEITFLDGHVMRGCYECAGKGKGKAARTFSTHVRRLLRPPSPAPAPSCEAA
jgi:hypothetical protein